MTKAWYQDVVARRHAAMGEGMMAQLVAIVFVLVPIRRLKVATGSMQKVEVSLVVF